MLILWLLWLSLSLSSMGQWDALDWMYRPFITRPGQVFSITMGESRSGQPVVIYTFGSQPMNITYTSFEKGQHSMKQEGGKELQFAVSEPVGERLHLVRHLYNYSKQSKLWSDMFIRLDIQIENRTEPVGYYHQLTVDDNQDLFLIETSKPTYRPNETVWFGVVCLQPKHWSLLGGGDFGNASEPRFSIMVNSSETNTVVCRWDDLTASQSKKLSFHVPENSSQGMWTISVNATGRLESTSILVLDREDLMPTIQFHPIRWTKSILYGSFRIGFCANQTDGRPVGGPVKLILCRCTIPMALRHENYPSSSFTANFTEALISRDSCPTEGESTKHQPCAVLDDVIRESNGCLEHSFERNPTVFDQVDSADDSNLIVCARVFDAPTNRFYSFCEQLASDVPDHTTIVVNPFYKYGLPMVGFAKIPPPLVSTNVKYVLEMSYSEDSCKLENKLLDLWLPKDISTHTVLGEEFSRSEHSRLELDTSEDSVARFTVPPIFSDSPMLAAIRQLTQGSFLETTDDDVVKLLPAHETTYEAIQLWPSPLEPISAESCEPIVNLSVIGNTKLTDKKWFIFAISRGTIIELNVVDVDAEGQPEVDFVCQDQDGPLGHYVCLNESDVQNDTIECLPGWQGIGCLEPVCSPHCNPQSGYCTLPYECQCRSGWRGDGCNECENCWDRVCHTPHGLVQWDCESTSNQTLATKAQMESQRSSVHSTKFIFQRNLTAKLPPNVFGELKFVVFYFHHSENGTIEPISTRGVIRRPEFCPRPHEDISIKFDRTHALPGSTVQVVVLSDKSVVDENAVCHVRVWDERLLAQNGGRQNLLYVDAYEKRFKQNSGSVTSQQVLTGQFYDFHTFGFSLGAMPTDSYDGCNIQRNMKHLSEQVVRARTDNWHTDHVLYEVGTPEVLQNLTTDKDRLNWGLRYSFIVPQTGYHLRASAFCYGEEKGVWSSMSMPLRIDDAIGFQLTSVPGLDLLETANLQISLFIHGPFQENNCVRFFVRTKFDDQIISFSGPTAFSSACICNRTVERKFTTQFTAEIPGETLINAELFLLPQNSGCGIKPNSAEYYQTRSIKPMRTIVKRIRVRPGENPQRTATALKCFTTPDHNESLSVDIKLPSSKPDGKNHSDFGPIYFSYSENLIDPILRGFQQYEQRPLLTAYDNLAALSTAIQSLNHLAPYHHHPGTTSQSLVTKINSAIHSAFVRLASFKTYPGQLNNSLMYAETGLVSDPKLNLLVYRTLNHLERSPSARAPSMTVILRSELDGLFREFNTTYAVSDCHNNRNQTLDERGLSFLSQWYIAMKESPYEQSYRERLDRNIEATTHHLAICLALFAHREHSQSSGRLERFQTSTLANLAYALSLIEPNLDSLTEIIDIVLRRQIRTRSTVDTSEQEVHWEESIYENDERSAEQPANPVEITYHAYMALFNTGKNLTELVPIVRWQLKHLSVFGTVSDPIDSYFIGLQLFTFMRHIGILNPTGTKRSQSSYEITLAQEDNFSVPLMGSFNGSPMSFTQGMLTLLDGPSEFVQGMNFTVAPRVSSTGCFSATVTQISCRSSDSIRVNSSTDGFTLSIEESKNKVSNPLGAQVAVCLNSSLNESLQLTVRGQTGWELQSIPESDSFSTSVVSDTEGNVVRFVLTTEEYTGCLEFLYTQTATMLFAHPMKVVAESSNPVRSRKTEAFYLLPTSDNPSDIRPSLSQSHRWTSKQDCHNLSIRPFEYSNAMRNFSGNVTAICKAPVFLFHLQTKNAWLYVAQVSANREIRIWQLQISRLWRQCFVGLKDWTIVSSVTEEFIQQLSLEQALEFISRSPNTLTLDGMEFDALLLTNEDANRCSNLHETKTMIGNSLTYNF
ncbi:delta-like protein 4 [Clonorchis sinensis]|uniref:Delta-like protein 4 n=1 Tax=Clonorchis sinensis TaxID=79923 RepID=H2KS35_CLOSI|nr:delta-like protein 4 [Clonorchis sinensis]